jgi:hypothetical protein
LDRRLFGPKSRSGCGGEKNSQTLLGLEPLIIQPITESYTTELSWFLLPKERILELYPSHSIGRSSLFVYKRKECGILVGKSAVTWKDWERDINVLVEHMPPAAV